MSERDKFLTEVMGECWHIREGIEYYTDSGTPYHVCRCGKKLVFHEISTFYNPNFSTWIGFGKLWEWATQQDWWEKFTDLCEYNRQFHQKWAHQVLPEIIHQDKFADAVYKFLKEGRNE